MQKIALITITILVLLSASHVPVMLNNGFSTAPIQTPPSTYLGTGSKIDVFEFAHNQSQMFSNGKNDTTFMYPSTWYPVAYRGYRLHAEVFNLRKTVNPVDNGDFESYPEVGTNWTLSHSGWGPVVSSATTSVSGNPGSCLDVELLYSKVAFTRASHIENDFEYVSQLVPDTLSVSFDIRFSSDITKANWLQVSVILLDSLGTPKGLWVESTSNFHPTSWTHISFPTFFINGSMTLRASVEKTDASNLDVDGHIYFDNFDYQIGSYAPPSEVGLTLNDTNLADTVGANGEVDIYADVALKEEINYVAAWNTTRVFCFNSVMEITFDFQFSMYVKSENAGSALTWFNVELDANPNWLINYSIPAERPPLGYEGYQFGLHLPQGWVLSAVRNKIGNLLTTYHYNPISQFFLLDEGVADFGDTYSLYALSQNYVSEVQFQKSPSSSGPWTNVSIDDFFIIGEYLRVYATIIASGSENTANISILLPNGTRCYSETSPALDPMTNVYTSRAWCVEPLCEEFAGQLCVALISYNSSFQCGFRSQSFKILNLAQGTLISPTQDAVLGWSGVTINVSWQNAMTDSYVINGRAILRYEDEFGQVQFAEMIPNGYGSYSIRISTLNYEAATPLTFDVEFYRRGFINATYQSGTTLQFSVTVNVGIPPTLFGIIDTRFFFIVFFAVFLITAIGLSYRTYRRRIVIPRQLARERTLQKVLDMYNDVTNLSRVVVLQRSSGLPIFDPLQGSGIDASIFGGFLSAIQAFAIDVANGAKDQDLQSSIRLSEISYEGFRIIINDGSLIRTALVYKGTPSETLKEGLNQFTQRFEERYQGDLQHYGNQPEKFRSATDLLEEVFHVSLLFPHSVEPKTKDVPLSVQESQLYYVAIELTKNREFVYLQEIVNKYLETIQENPVELLNAVLQLREKKLLIPSDFFMHINSNAV